MNDETKQNVLKLAKECCLVANDNEYLDEAKEYEAFYREAEKRGYNKAIEDAAKACEYERVAVIADEDYAYNVAITNSTEAIRKLVKTMELFSERGLRSIFPHDLFAKDALAKVGAGDMAGEKK